jgi:hypothetical protein
MPIQRKLGNTPRQLREKAKQQVITPEADIEAAIAKAKPKRTTVRKVKDALGLK